MRAGDGDQRSHRAKLRRDTAPANFNLPPRRVNLILFEPAEIDRPLSRKDRRSIHLLEVLRRRVGETFDAGLINGPRGKGTLTAIEADTLAFSFAWSEPAAIEAPVDARITLLVGLPRPQTARDILRDATTLGVAALHFVQTEKAERSYAQSTLWSSGEWRRHLVTGAEQAFATRIPEVSHGRDLAEILARLTEPASLTPDAPPRCEAAVRLALDNYESPTPLGECEIPRNTSVLLAIGAERGWSAGERELLRAHRFAFAHLGSRVLRTETAVVAALAIVRAKLGLM